VARARAQTRARTHRTHALLLKRVGYGEADLVLTLLTETLGRVSALARGARKSSRRFGGALEPMHTLRIDFDERAGAELGTLRDATLERVRARLTANLDRLDAAGRALGWVRRAAPPSRPEPDVWLVLVELLDRLDAEGPVDARKELAESGLRLLSAFGWGIELERCVGCGKPCEPARSAMLDPVRGGLVCRSCGGARLVLAGRLRQRLALAGRGQPALEAGDVTVTLELVEAALAAHMGL
jgi:DNA repair protein RecO (recombination protein O)